MTAPVAPAATDFEVSADFGVLWIATARGHRTALSAGVLRAACKCAHCRRARFDERFPSDFRGVAITGVNDLGYGLNLSFSDGHNRGIYPKGYLLDLAGN
ncbi:MAG: gamma-butyrobetaine hydroxylase-like domain-containing protein [Bradyrhizobium sp.]|uniref:gamma-butyrobetaine hydroxylase-like domain-containing protein n=1 Tax=Bradyrhizobium sp. TaxID=376 RepID=UPI002A2B13C3|nr:DUF971 domain-containing protein [Bradyrhizobium sp.]